VQVASGWDARRANGIRSSRGSNHLDDGWSYRHENKAAERQAVAREDADTRRCATPRRGISDSARRHNLGVRQIATLRVSQVTAKYGEHAPMATVCCNACRTCVQTNLLGIAMGAVAGAGLAVRRLLARRAD